MVGHYPESTTEAVGTAAGAALGNEFSGGSFKPFGALLGAVIGNKIGEKISPPKRVMPGIYTHCGKAYSSSRKYHCWLWELLSLKIEISKL